MSIELRWLISQSASSLSTAAAIAQRREGADRKLARVLADPVDQLLRAFGGDRISEETVFAHLVPLAAGIDNDRQLAEVAWRKIVGQPTDSDIQRLALAIGAIERESATVQPELVDQLELRARVLRQQWEARGPGLMLQIGRLTDEGFAVSRADVLVVHPFLGGGGRAFLPYNAIAIEGVLANPHADLPEVLRMGWLLSQLNADVPRWSESIPPARLAEVIALAMIPVVLIAAETVELARCDADRVRRAIEVWCPGVRSDSGDVVWRWWTACRDAPTRWPVALAALDRMTR